MIASKCLLAPVADLTLTSVVFELIKVSCKDIFYKNLTLTSVVFEFGVRQYITVFT